MKKEKTYTIQGVMEYAHCVDREIKAKNKKEALQKFKEMVDKFIDPATAEFQKMFVELADVQEVKSELNKVRNR